MKFYVKDAVDRYTMLKNAVVLSSKTGKEILMGKDDPIKEVFLFHVEVELFTHFMNQIEKDLV